ncbi:hypothetical protein GCM10027347_16870 [Larkinella harenae]
MKTLTEPPQPRHQDVLRTSVFTLQWRMALVWLVLAGAIGMGLRMLVLWPVEAFNYMNWLHAHSHVVLLGWAFNALLTAIWSEFVAPEEARTYRHWWLALQLSVAGMLALFPIQGYAAGSILFSTLHVWLTYGIGIKLWRHLRPDQTFSATLLRFGVGFLFLSTLGPYAVGILKAKGLAHSNAYNLALYFYLHFLYNGWFVFGILALLMRQLERWKVVLPDPIRRYGLVAWVISCGSSYSLSALWTDPPELVWALGAFSAILQLGTGGWLAGWLWQRRATFRQHLQPWTFTLYRLAWLAFILKLLLQTASALPWAAQWAYEQRSLVIAYLHLVFIGVISFFLFGKAIQDKHLTVSDFALKSSIGFFVALETILVTEPILNRFLNDSLPAYFYSLFVVSAGLWVGFLLLLTAQLQISWKWFTYRDPVSANK